jgi:hypothetical protein
MQFSPRAIMLLGGYSEKDLSPHRGSEEADRAGETFGGEHPFLRSVQKIYNFLFFCYTG